MPWKYRSDELDSLTLAGGIDLASAGGTRPPTALFHAGGSPAMNTADGSNSTPVVTEIYLSAVFVPFTVLATGISVFNGSVVATDKVRVILYNDKGNVVASSAAAGFQPTTADVYENVAFALGSDGTTAVTTVVLPSGTYYLGTIYNGTTNRFNAHTVGCFPGGKVTGAVFGTAGVSALLTGVTMPTAFTAASLPPIVSLY